jgi:hypothetical protein
MAVDAMLGRLPGGFLANGGFAFLQKLERDHVHEASTKCWL